MEINFKINTFYFFFFFFLLSLIFPGNLLHKSKSSCKIDWKLTKKYILCARWNGGNGGQEHSIFHKYLIIFRLLQQLCLRVSKVLSGHNLIEAQLGIIKIESLMLKRTNSSKLTKAWNCRSFEKENGNIFERFQKY